MPPSRSWFPDSGRGSQWRPRALDCDGRRERSVRVGRSGAAGAPNGDVHSVGARRCLCPTSNRNARFSALFFEKLDFKICIAPSRRDSTSHDSGNVERAPRWQTVWRDRWRTNFKSWASTPEIQTVESERLFLAPCWDEAERKSARGKHPRVLSTRERASLVSASRRGRVPELWAVSGRAGRPRTPRFLMPPKKKKAAKKEAPAPASAAAAPGVAAKATDDSAMQYIVMAECVSSRRFLPPYPPPTSPDLHRRPYPSPFPSDRRNQRKKRSLTQTKTKLAELCVPRPAFLRRHPPRATFPQPLSCWSADLGAPSSRRSARPRPDL